jgi:hypothetical protein
MKFLGNLENARNSYDFLGFLKISYDISIRSLSAHSAAEFNISPGRWQQVWFVAIVPPERWGKMDGNDFHTAWGDFKALISLLHHYKNYACSFSLVFFFFFFLFVS